MCVALRHYGHSSGYLCDLLVVDEAGEPVQHFFELPVDSIGVSPWSQHPHYYTLTFEWGAWEGDVFAIERHPHAATASTNAFLHPIVRRYDRGTLVAEHHILEDLFGMYAAAGSPSIYKSRPGRSVENTTQKNMTNRYANFLPGSAQRLGPLVTPHGREV